MCIVYKFCDIQSNNCGGYEGQLFEQQASISSGVSLATFAMHCGEQYSIFFHYYSLGVTLLCRAGYTLGKLLELPTLCIHCTKHWNSVVYTTPN